MPKALATRSRWGMAAERSSGISSRLALYSGCIRWRSVGAEVSKTTARCEGFCLVISSIRVAVKPKMAEVLKPLLVYMGLRMRAKCAR